MWSELFIENKEPLIHEMDRFINEFQKLKGFIENENVDEMRQMMRSSTMRRTLFDKKKN